jgi:hypothetical protein
MEEINKESNKIETNAMLRTAYNLFSYLKAWSLAPLGFML